MADLESTETLHRLVRMLDAANNQSASAQLELLVAKRLIDTQQQMLAEAHKAATDLQQRQVALDAELAQAKALASQLERDLSESHKAKNSLIDERDALLHELRIARKPESDFAAKAKQQAAVDARVVACLEAAYPSWQYSSLRHNGATPEHLFIRTLRDLDGVDLTPAPWMNPDMSTRTAGMDPDLAQRAIRVCERYRDYVEAQGLVIRPGSVEQEVYLVGVESVTAAMNRGARAAQAKADSAA